jgi:hypothetical protein
MTRVPTAQECGPVSDNVMPATAGCKRIFGVQLINLITAVFRLERPCQTPAWPMRRAFRSPGYAMNGRELPVVR